jgi:hypothetical protein
MRSLLTMFCLLLASSEGSAPPPAMPRLPVFEGHAIVLSAQQATALSRGEPAVQMLNPKDGRVIAAFAIVAIKDTRQAFVSRLTNVAQSLRAQGVRSFGIFRTPVTSGNVSPFAIDAGDIAALRKCRIGKCEFKLPESEMARAKAMLDGADGAAKLSAYARRRAAEYVTDYRARGNAALVVYDDNGKGGVRASDAATALLGASPWLEESAPAVQRYLQQYPHGRPRDANESLYWSVESLKGLRPTFTMNDIVVSSPSPGVSVAVTKQIYADHYFEGMLDEKIIADRRDGAHTDGIYLMMLRQYRFDNLPGGLLDIRGRARAALEERVTDELRRAEAAAVRR